MPELIVTDKIPETETEKISELNKVTLGEMLREKGIVTNKEVEEALKEQEDLRNKKIGEIIAENSNLEQTKIDEAIINGVKENKSRHRIRVGDILVAKGLVTRDQVNRALSRQKEGKKKRVGTLLVERGFITEEQLLTTLAQQFGTRIVNLEKIKPQKEAIDVLPEDIVKNFGIFPVSISGNLLTIATSDPTNFELIDTIRFKTNKKIEMVASTPSQIQKAIKANYDDKKVPEEILDKEDEIEDLIEEINDDDLTIEEEVDDAGMDESNSQVIKLVNKLLIDAYTRRVSDIHFEPYMDKRGTLVRYRIDGDCQEIIKIPPIYKKAVVSRIKIIANLDISERRRPQSGKIRLRHKNKLIEYRVETTPTVGGCEDAVLRILSSSKPEPIDKLCFSPNNLELFKKMLSKPYGMILCVGPTGSGKTTSLHSALSHINTSDRKIWTAEDPVEITQERLRQVQVHAKIGFNFSDALRSFLRADPDVIMVGEMRDVETAKIAIEASLTGHLVFSTLHTNSAPETIIRLIEMGMNPISFSEALIGVLAQRLIKRLCTKCKEAYHPTEEEYLELVDCYGESEFKNNGLPAFTSDLELMKPVGCEECGYSGYSRRVAIHELLFGTEELKIGIKKRLMTSEIKQQALKDGMRTLLMDGIEKIFQGITDFKQVLRVCM